MNNPDTGDHVLTNVVVCVGTTDTSCAPPPVVVPVQSFKVTKTASLANAKPGDTVTYTIVVTNTGKVDYTAADPAAITDDLSAVLDDATYNNDVAPSAGTSYTAPTLSWSGALPIGGSVTLTYSVQVNDPDKGDHVLTNVVVCVGTTDPGCAPPPVVVPVAGISLVKSANLTTITAAGQVITYSFKVTNIGGNTLTGLFVTDDPAVFTGTGTLVADQLPGYDASAEGIDHMHGDVCHHPGRCGRRRRHQ